MEDKATCAKRHGSPVQESEVLQWTATGFDFAAPAAPSCESEGGAATRPGSPARVRADSVVERAVEAPSQGQGGTGRGTTIN